LLAHSPASPGHLPGHLKELPMSHDSFPTLPPHIKATYRLPKHLAPHLALGRALSLYLCLLILLLSACSSSAQNTPIEPIEAPNSAAQSDDATDDEATDEDGAEDEADDANEESDTAEQNGTGQIVEIDPYPLDETTGPVRVQIEEIGLDAPIIAMGWSVATVEGERTTVWDVPLDLAGWHINSAGAGGMGNTVVSGRQVEGAAVFAPLALGSVAPGQEVLLTDGDGITFVYRITDVTEPIPVTGATPDELARGATYFEPTETARLTLVTGWPDFTTTHRIFAIAEFVGVLR
jgi:hypothetical protein